MAYSLIKAFSLSLVPLLYCSDAFVATALAQDEPDVRTAAEQVIAEQPADGMGDISSAFFASCNGEQ